MKKLIEAIVSLLELTTIEQRTGIMLVEAVAADDFQKQLMLLVPDPQVRQDIRDSAILLAQAGVGISPDSVRKMIALKVRNER